jgi:uncharacterized protein YjbJ (UPF0337 family)
LTEEKNLDRSTVEKKGARIMNWDQVEGQWKQRRGKAARNWGKVMNDELAAIAGKHEQLVGILQQKYGIAKEDAKRQVTEFKTTIERLKRANADLLRSQKLLSTRAKKSNSILVKAKLSSRKRARS